MPGYPVPVILQALIPAAYATCPAGAPTLAQEGAGVPWPPPNLDGASSSFAVSGPLTLTLPMARPAKASVTLSTDCLSVSVDGRVGHRDLRVQPWEPEIVADMYPRRVRWATLRVSVGPEFAEREVRDVVLEETEAGYDVSLSQPIMVSDLLGEQEIWTTWSSSGGIQNSGDAPFLAGLDLLVAPLPALRGKDRLALERLWAGAPMDVPLDTVDALQRRRLPAAERAALGHLIYPRGDRRHAGARVYTVRGVRLLVNGREVSGRATTAALPGHSRTFDATEFVLPVGGEVWLRVDGNCADEWHAVVGETSKVYLGGPHIQADPRSGIRVVHTAGAAIWTLCGGREPVDGLCPRTSVERLATLYATATLGDEERSVDLYPAASGTYTLEWGRTRIVVRWTPPPRVRGAGRSPRHPR